MVVKALKGCTAGDQVPGSHPEGEDVAAAAPHAPPEDLGRLVGHSAYHLWEGTKGGGREVGGKRGGRGKKDRREGEKRRERRGERRGKGREEVRERGRGGKR